MSHSERQQVFFVESNPQGWLAASLPKFADTLRQPTPESAPGFPPVDALILQQEERWERTTNVACHTSAFTVVIPVHNEERMLPSHMAMLLLSDIPDSVPAQFLFIVNNTTDKSKDRITEFFHRLGVPQTEAITSKVDPDVYPEGLKVSRGQKSFILLETPTKSKANALSLGNEWAVRSGHEVAINIDADRFVEPDAMRILFGEAYAQFTDQSKEVVLVDGFSIEERAGRGKKHKIYVQDPHNTQNLPEVHGPLFAWKPKWIEAMGGFPKTLTEDYATAVMATNGGKDIHHGYSRVWGHAPANRADKYRAGVRYIHGALQAQVMFPEHKAAIAHDHPHLLPFGERVKHLIRSDSFSTIQGMLFLAARTVYHEIMRIDAYRRFRKDPHALMWQPVESTK